MINGEIFQSPTVTLTLIRQCLLSNLSEIFPCTSTYSNFMLLDRLLFELSCKNTHKHTHTDAHTHTDSDEYSIVAFCKNATIITISFYIIDSFAIFQDISLCSVPSYKTHGRPENYNSPN